MNDLIFAFRQLLKNPGVTDLAVFTLALGIGKNTAIFSVVVRRVILTAPSPPPCLLQSDIRFAAVPRDCLLSGLRTGIPPVQPTFGREVKNEA